jgi:hypothetical protein
MASKTPLQEQQDKLKQHLPFIKHMLEKVRNTEFYEKWKKMNDIISTDKK